MPVMDGYEATKLIRELEKKYLVEGEEQTYIVGLTAHSTEGYKNKCFETGMDGFSKYCISYHSPYMFIVTKPVESEKLEELLKQLNII